MNADVWSDKLMKLISACRGSVQLELSDDELLIIHNSLNEVCNGIDLPEFHARIGAFPDQVRHLLSSVGSIVDLAE
jgi:hypothetical protein